MNFRTIALRKGRGWLGLMKHVFFSIMWMAVFVCATYLWKGRRQDPERGKKTSRQRQCDSLSSGGHASTCQDCFGSKSVTCSILDHFGTIGSDLNIMCPLKAEKVNWTNPKKKQEGSQSTLLQTKVYYNSAGKYLCMDADSPNQSSSVYVLIQQQDPLPIKCNADSYSSSVLSCSIEDYFGDPVLVRAKAYRLNNLDNSTWGPSQRKNDPVNFIVPISSAFCPHEEHAYPFHVSVEVMTGKAYWKVDMPISMADVVVPGTPENIRIKGDQITWSYPSSWPRPSSFFPLLFQVKATRRDKTNDSKMLEKTTYSKGNIREFQVRCRDLYSPSSPWSAWNHWVVPNV